MKNFLQRVAGASAWVFFLAVALVQATFIAGHFFGDGSILKGYRGPFYSHDNMVITQIAVSSGASCFTIVGTGLVQRHPGPAAVFGTCLIVLQLFIWMNFGVDAMRSTLR